MINKAIMFATACHGNQVRKGTEIPYIIHPLEAGTIAASLANKEGQVDQEVICAALLHDVCEDAYVSRETLVEMFGSRVADLVGFQSEDKTKTWQERKQHTIDSLIANKVKEVEIVTLADKLSNLRSIRKDYNVIGEKLWKRFNVTDKEKHKWYYESIGNAMELITDTPEYKEYMNLVNQVFYRYW